MSYLIYVNKIESNVVIGNDFVNSKLTFINGGKIGNNNNGIIATNQTNLIVKDNNTSVTLGGGGNGGNLLVSMPK